MNEEKKPLELTQESPSQAAPAAEQSAPAAAPEKSAAAHAVPHLKPEMSLGEKWYNRILYQGVNYWLNLGISLVITDFFLHGKGNAFYKAGMQKFTSGLSAVGMKKPLAKWVAGQALGTFSLNSGGNILLIPTKFAEDNKRNIVYWLNEKFGVDQTASNGHKETPDEIYIEQEQPEQSWGSMIWRRFLGWGATTAVGMTLDKFAAQKLPVPKMVDGDLVTHKGGQDVFTDLIKNGKYGVNALLKQGGATGNAIVATPWVQRYMGYAALDSFYTIITSKILHATNGAGKMKAPHEIGDDDAPPAILPIGDSLKPGEHLEPVVVPKGKHAADIIRSKEKDEGFAANISRQADAHGSAQLGA